MPLPPELSSLTVSQMNALLLRDKDDIIARDVVGDRRRLPTLAEQMDAIDPTATITIPLRQAEEWLLMLDNIADAFTKIDRSAQSQRGRVDAIVKVLEDALNNP